MCPLGCCQWHSKLTSSGMFIMLSWYSKGIYASLVGIMQITLKRCINFNKVFKYLSPSVTLNMWSRSSNFYQLFSFYQLIFPCKFGEFPLWKRYSAISRNCHVKFNSLRLQCISLKMGEKWIQCITLKMGEKWIQCITLKMGEKWIQCITLKMGEKWIQCITLKMGEKWIQCIILKMGEKWIQCITLKMGEKWIPIQA